MSPALAGRFSTTAPPGKPQVPSALNEAPENLCGSRVWGPFLRDLSPSWVFEFRGEAEPVDWPPPEF